MQTSFVHRFHKTNQDLLILIISIQKKILIKKYSLYNLSNEYGEEINMMLLKIEIMFIHSGKIFLCRYIDKDRKKSFIDTLSGLIRVRLLSHDQCQKLNAKSIFSKFARNLQFVNQFQFH